VTQAMSYGAMILREGLTASCAAARSVGTARLAVNSNSKKPAVANHDLPIKPVPNALMSYPLFPGMRFRPA